MAKTKPGSKNAIPFIVSVLLIGGALALTFYLRRNPESILDNSSLTETPTPGVQTSREYPPDMTEDEKLALVPQTDQVSREEHRRWDETIKRIAAETDTLTLVMVGSDCFGRPSVLKTGISESINVYNSTDAQITLGMGDQRWDIPAKGTTTIRPEFKILPDFKDYFSYGYGCGSSDAPSGLFFVSEFKI